MRVLLMRVWVLLLLLLLLLEGGCSGLWILRPRITARRRVPPSRHTCRVLGRRRWCMWLLSRVHLV